MKSTSVSESQAAKFVNAGFVRMGSQAETVIAETIERPEHALAGERQGVGQAPPTILIR